MEELFKALFSNYIGKLIFKLSFFLFAFSMHTWLSCFAFSAQEQMLTTATTLVITVMAAAEKAIRKVETLKILCYSGASKEQPPVWVLCTAQVTENSRQVS